MKFILILHVFFDGGSSSILWGTTTDRRTCEMTGAAITQYLLTARPDLMTQHTCTPEESA